MKPSVLQFLCFVKEVAAHYVDVIFTGQENIKEQQTRVKLDESGLRSLALQVPEVEP